MLRSYYWDYLFGVFLGLICYWFVDSTIYVFKSSFGVANLKAWKIILVASYSVDFSCVEARKWEEQNMEEGLFPLQISINASIFWPVKEMLNCNYLASHSTVCDQIPLSRKLLPLRALLLGKHDNEQWRFDTYKCETRRTQCTNSAWHSPFKL